MAMLKWTYVVLGVVLGTATTLVVSAGSLVVFLAADQVLIGLLTSVAAFLWGLLAMVQFVRVEGLEEEGFWWWPFPMWPAWTPLGVRFALVLLVYAVFGWVIYQGIMSPDEFHLPKLPALS